MGPLSLPKWVTVRQSLRRPVNFVFRSAGLFPRHSFVTWLLAVVVLRVKIVCCRVIRGAGVLETNIDLGSIAVGELGISAVKLQIRTELCLMAGLFFRDSFVISNFVSLTVLTASKKFSSKKNKTDLARSVRAHPKNRCTGERVEGDGMRPHLILLGPGYV